MVSEMDRVPVMRLPIYPALKTRARPKMFWMNLAYSEG
jgi:hypothetical protein